MKKDIGEVNGVQWYSEYGDENNKYIGFHRGIDLRFLLLPFVHVL